MQKQEKILTFSKVIFFILYSIKFYKKTNYSKNLFFTYVKNKSFLFNKRTNKRNYASIFIFNKIFKNHLKIYFKRKIKLKLKFNSIKRDKKIKYLFSNILFLKKFKRFKFYNFFKKFKLFKRKIKNLHLFYKNIFFYRYKKFVFFNKKYITKSKSKLFIIIKRNNYYYLQGIYLNKKLLYISNSKLFNKNIKYKVAAIFINKLFLIRLLQILNNNKISSFTFTFFIKKKRRLLRRGLKKYTKNFIDKFYFINFINTYKYFKKKNFFNIKVKFKIVFNRSHSKRTEKLKKKRRK